MTLRDKYVKKEAYLCGEGLGGGDGVLTTRIEVHTAPRGARNERADLVDDGKGRQIILHAEHECAVSVLGFARLRHDADAAGAGAVAVLARGGQRVRHDFGGVLELDRGEGAQGTHNLGAVGSGEERRAAGGDEEVLDMQKRVKRPLETAQLHETVLWRAMRKKTCERADKMRNGVVE